jgi:hypothetical protein
MKTTGHPKQVGAPDPERKTSPILDDEAGAEEDLTHDFEPETGVCYFNGKPYGVGEYVCSGNELLHCEERGVWVKKGPCKPV